MNETAQPDTPRPDASRPTGNLPSIRFLLWGTLGCAGVVLLVYWLFPIFGAMGMSRDASCRAYLEQVGYAMQKYRARHGTLPQTVAGPNGDVHSWRVLLPELFGGWRSGGYRRDLPWDSPENKQAIRDNLAGHFYQCRVAGDIRGNPFASFVMLTRPGEDWQEKLPQNAVLIVESQWSGIRIAEPRDLSIEEVLSEDSPFHPGSLYSAHNGYVRALRVDGEVIEIPTDLLKDELRAVLAGGGPGS